MNLTAARILIAASALALTAAPLAAHADTTYDFTGTAFASGTFAGDTIDGSFTTTNPLADNAVTDIDSDLSFTIDNARGQAIDTISGVGAIDVDTNPAGAIDYWNVGLSGGDLSVAVSGVIFDGTTYATETINQRGDGNSYGTGGTWRQVDPAVTPEPSSLLLLGTGTLAIAYFMRKRMLATA